MVDYSQEIQNYLESLFPINRSLTGDGNRETLEIIKKIIPIEIKEYKSGENVFDWTIPKEWRVKSAWIKDKSGKKIVDFSNSNIHLVGYSKPIAGKFKKKALLKHLHFSEDQPKTIPYRTSYYQSDWGFCLSFDDFIKYFSVDENYEFEVFIDAEFYSGSLSIGELILHGYSKEEFLVSTYICHPSMANDNLSGVLLTAFLARELMNQNFLEKTYRIIFVPETVGAIAYCSKNYDAMQKIKSGLVVTTCGGQGQFGYKKSWNSDHYLNSMIEDVLIEENIKFKSFEFDIHGSDERQYSSQGFRINCCSITKDKYYDYKYYHTSHDDLNFVNGRQINESLNLYLRLILDKVDKNIFLSNTIPNCEVMLSKHNLYPKTGGAINPTTKKDTLDIILWSLFLLDGKTGLYEISKKLGIDIGLVYQTIQELISKGILVRNG